MQVINEDLGIMTFNTEAVIFPSELIPLFVKRLKKLDYTVHANNKFHTTTEQFTTNLRNHLLPAIQKLN